ncbi:PIG-U-domain-containing protein [Testicularia cyperi]|uniref:PIG-U-domain-containing protein n=1 Tax=Testicularia cyperi TaxID=1882483 RepID=A0A317XFQ6_9BASI|nr:PIG-U-domain-containing protein [Testicularia cyperi]
MMAAAIRAGDSPAHGAAPAQKARQAAQPSRLVLRLLLTGGLAVRLILFHHTDISRTLQDRPELSTPVNSWRALRELDYLYHNPSTVAYPPSSPFLGGSSGSTLYSTDTVHHSPLLLPLLHVPLAQAQAGKSLWLASLIWSMADLVSAELLFHICAKREKTRIARQNSVWPWDRSRANIIAALFLFNPYTLATCLSRSSAPLEIATLLTSVYAAMSASALLGSLSWAAASLLSLYPVLMLPLLIQLTTLRAGELVYDKEIDRINNAARADKPGVTRRAGFLVDRIRSAKRWAVVRSLILYPSALVAGLYLSRAIVLSRGRSDLPALFEALKSSATLHGSAGWEWTEQVYGTQLLMTDLTPNLGLWWYFFMEIFDHFRDFFLLTFNVHVASYALPFMIKYRQDPLFGITLMTGVFAVFKSYPTLGDHAVFLSLLSLHSQIFEYLRYPLISALIYIYCTFLSPAFHHLWLTAGSANANFFYAITLVWALGGGMLVLDAMWAWGRERWEAERKPIRRPRDSAKDVATPFAVSVNGAVGGDTEAVSDVSSSSTKNTSITAKRIVVQI